jgi:putative CocE/NonD family hydrolase
MGTGRGRTRRRRLGIVATSAVCVAASGATMPAAQSAAAAAPPWQPEPASYGVGSTSNVGVTMADGTVLRVDVYYPTDRATGRASPGRFPVLLTQTPYGKESLGADPYFVQRGYLEVVADVRGTGDSGGSWGLFDPVQASDGAALVNWVARLPGSSGAVGLFGSSYLGINQFLTAARLGPGSPVKAMFPVISADDIYRDTAFQGGIIDSEFGGIYLGLTGALNMANPPLESLAAPSSGSGSGVASVEAQHAQGLATYHAASVANTESGGDQAYDGAYWAARNPANVLSKIVSDGIPAFLVGGWFDLFQRGEPLNYAGLQNAWAHRPVGAPMRPDQPVTGRYQLMMGPWYHLTAGQGIDLHRIQLEWFDTWLRGEPTGMGSTRTPLHLFQLGANRWTDASTWPLPQAQATTYYLSAGPSGSSAPSTNDGVLSPARPGGAGGADPVLFTGATNPCDRQSDQWSMGAGSVAASSAGLSAEPCTTDDRALQTGPNALTYTTHAFGTPTVLAGPIDATIYATTTTKDAEWVATVEDVAPSGASTPLTAGALLGSFRTLDASRSWLAPGGQPLLPYHPYTQASVTPVTAGKVTRFDVEVFPTLAALAPGHRLRLTITTSDTPHLGPNPAQLANLVGGAYQVQRNASAASYIELPLAPATALTAPCGLCH